ncbi:BZ3500_MvSof-1268-A1-R1_Chr11-1g03207 [Microbotryum saponariae]|uniref:BZ3500_MvSof-1268-A1-R1_Chr11-1g03207 protein n=1 Tax=Microbotryum saponariae TaxID=289078 RepID=A0A2X0NCW8_9BASI|nr:BZ3501_MvSof-1269-A2-R1_Chr11g02782 [Microbotryum saponariae]SDA03767.1 BZ3500_MvSof-1268-A1-R1_Chr11-1g03207 [Microbotryum saponariae]
MSDSQPVLQQRASINGSHGSGVEDDEKASEIAVAAPTGPGVPFSKAAEQRLLRKIDWKVVPFLSLLYLMSFLDRVNIGQARLNGLEKDLHLKGNQFSIALLVFFTSYVFFETPAVIFVRRLRPSRFLPAAMMIWGVVMTLMGLVTNFTGLTMARFFLGFAEAPLFPAACFYLTSWYKRKEQNIRISFFFSAATLAGAFGGLIAHGLSMMNGLGGLAGWRWIFIIEGIVTFLVACVAPFVMTDFPEEANFLTQDEQQEVLRRLKADRGPSLQTEFAWSQVRAAFTDWKTYCFTLIYIVSLDGSNSWRFCNRLRIALIPSNLALHQGVAEPFYSIALFIPTIVAALGTFSLSQSQLMSTPPFFLGFATTLFSALYSDRLGHRGLFNVFWISLASIGFIILLARDPRTDPKVAYFALFLCVGGLCPCVSSAWVISNSISWIGNNYPNRTKRSAAMGLFFSVGNAGGIVSSLVYFKQDSPRFIRGHSVGLGFALMTLILSLGLTLHLRSENLAKDAKYGPAQDGDEDFDQLSAEEQQARIKAWGLEDMPQEALNELAEE